MNLLNPITPMSDAKDLRHKVRRITLFALVVNLLLCLLKLAAGLLGSSQAMVADAMHSLSDSFSDIAILLGVHFWTAPPDERHPYGHWRIETLITSIIGLGLVVIATGITYRSFLNIHAGRTVMPTLFPLAVAILSLVVKEFLYQCTVRAGRKLRSDAVIANAWHHRSDAFSSIPAGIAILTARLNPDWAFMDQVGAIVVSGFVLYAAWKIIKPAAGDLLDEGVPATLRNHIGQKAENITGVSSVHAIRSRKVGPGYYLDLHVLVHPALTVRRGHDIATQVKTTLINEIPDIHDVIVHIEPDDEESGTKIN